MQLKTILSMIVLGASCSPAQSGSLHVRGTAGYLSEWEISGTVSEDTSNGNGALVGPIILKHTGLCMVNGPVEKSGEIRFKVSGWGPLSRTEATLTFQNVQCVYRGDFSDGKQGAMDCSDAKGVPLTLSLK